MSWGSCPGDYGLHALFFAFFIALIWVSLFMVPNTMFYWHMS
jgi:hypothetical protein